MFIDIKEEQRKRYLYWNRLKRARDEFQKVNPESNRSDWGGLFYEWFKETYGVQMHTDNSGMITGSYTVLDEHKFTIFLLKYS